MPEETGAVDIDNCPTRDRWGRCFCDICARCGYRRHMAIHGPLLGCAPGTTPYGHEFTSSGQ